MPTIRRRSAAAEKAPAKKAPAIKAPARKATAKKAAAIKAPARRATAKKAAAIKAPARKATATKAAAIKAPARKATAKPVLVEPLDEGIVLSGPPGQLRATVSVENAVGERLAIRGLAVHRVGHEAVAGSAAAVIPPGATAQVPVSVRLDPGTPPGDHVAEVEVGGLRREVVLRVEPDLALRVSPRRILATEGDRALSLVVGNEGNVAIPLAAELRARTDDGGPDPGPDVVLTMDVAPVVEPGTTVRVAVTVTVPTGLDPTRRHTARLPVGTADLDVIILPRTASETPS